MKLWLSRTCLRANSWFENCDILMWTTVTNWVSGNRAWNSLPGVTCSVLCYKTRPACLMCFYKCFYSLVLKTFTDGNSTASSGNDFQCGTVIPNWKAFPNLWPKSSSLPFRSGFTFSDLPWERRTGYSLLSRYLSCILEIVIVSILGLC